MSIKKLSGRNEDQLRPVSFQFNVYEFAAGSVLYQIGKTKILCSVTLQQGVPVFLKGQHTGWLTAEYAMLPASTTIRSSRESSTMKRNERSVEISRLIGRCLRSISDCSLFPDKTIYVDCDVLQADGGTRTASLTAAYLALLAAQKTWIAQGVINKPFLLDGLVAVSVATIKDSIVLDPDFVQDSQADADFNFVVSKSNKLIEIQGGAEKNPVSFEQFAKIQQMALQGAQTLFTLLQDALAQEDELPKESVKKQRIFSLANRISNT